MVNFIDDHSFLVIKRSDFFKKLVEFRKEYHWLLNCEDIENEKEAFDVALKKVFDYIDCEGD
jgi:hypothetical protein